MNKQADDLSGAEAVRHYQDTMRQSWDALAAWMQPPPAAENAARSHATSSKKPPENPTLQHALAGLKSYSDWLQSAAASASSAATPPGDWRQQMERLFAGAGQPFSHGFAGAGPAATNTFVDQWQAWLDGFSGGAASTAKPHDRPAVGFGFESAQNAQQQALADALARHLEALQRYQALMQRVNVQAIEKMQSRLSALSGPHEQIQSLKALYDLWVDCAEEAYAEIALSEDFRQAYGDMVNTQIRVRQLQQEQTEYLCQQLGIPTRSDFSSLGERLHALRREVRESRNAAPAHHDDELETLRREVASLREQLRPSRAAPSPSAKRPAAPKKAAEKVSRSAVKKSMSKTTPKKKVGQSARKSPASASRAKPARTARD